MQLSCLIYKFWTYFQLNPGPCPSWHSWLIRALLQFFWKAWVSLRWGRCSTGFNGPYCHAISPEHVLGLPPAWQTTQGHEDQPAQPGISYVVLVWVKMAFGEAIASKIILSIVPLIYLFWGEKEMTLACGFDWDVVRRWEQWFLAWLCSRITWCPSNHIGI